MDPLLRRESLSSATIAPHRAGYNKWPAAPAWLLSNSSESLRCGSIYIKVCPITMLHIAGNQNSMTNFPSCLFGSKSKWHFKSESNLLTFFNCNFALPNQTLWTVCQPTSMTATRLISILRMTPFTLDDWRRLPAAGKNIGINGTSTRHPWEWTLIFRIPTSQSVSNSSLVMRHESAQATMVTKTKSKIAQSIARTWPLARRSRWPVTPILPRSEGPNAFCPASKSCWTDTRRSTLPHIRSFPSNPMSLSSWSEQRTNQEQLNASGQRGT
jgi:hypothetical protein